jgi:hypothetical protein
MNRRVLLPWLNLAALVVMLAVNALANALPINGLTTGGISDRYSVLVTPAGYVFGIWGLIYLLLVAYVVYQLLPAGRKRGDLGAWFIVGCIANTLWLILWHYLRISWTLPVMVALLGSLIVIYLRIHQPGDAVTPATRWLVRVPFSVYLGWITVATIANVTAALHACNWGGWGIAPETWAPVMLVVAMAAAATMAWRHRDLAYGLVIVWALTGIAVRQSGSVVSRAGWVAAAATVALVVVAVLRAPDQHGPSTEGHRERGPSPRGEAGSATRG